MSRSADPVFRALDRLARCRWGQQGAGSVANPALALALLRRRLIRPIEGENTYALTIRGWRERETMRWDRKIRNAARGKA